MANRGWSSASDQWEKTFCFKVGRVPWKRVVEVNKYNKHQLDHWNSSAAEKAFNNAKRRFWQQANGFSCTTRLPDRDLYNDNNIDWNPSIDPQLLLELEEARKLARVDDDDEDRDRDSYDRNKYNVRIENYGSGHCRLLLEVDQNQFVPLQPSGWDVDDDYFHKTLQGMVVGD